LLNIFKAWQKPKPIYVAWAVMTNTKPLPTSHLFLRFSKLLSIFVKKTAFELKVKRS